MELWRREGKENEYVLGPEEELLNFGEVKVGETAEGFLDYIARIKLTFGQAVMKGVIGNAFSIGVDNCSNKLFEAGELCALHVKFTPTEKKAYESVLELPVKEDVAGGKEGVIKDHLIGVGK